MAVPVKQIGEAGAKAFSSFRETVQDLLVPELRAIKVQIESLTQEMRLRNEQLVQEMRLRDEQLMQEMRLRDERQTKAIDRLSEKLDFSMEFRDRLTQLEARLPKQ
ncbi:hypothetical protein Terro_0927 [Terriglobus roseus DSM 18391]|uniref:Uncharacterized protein n=1 Tax=Terriglobus roseus (strain DSM 18391 / NRRL B-41598 / KBS 63) TaxID=926566 RepID=I3ZDD1_TERRK|nr:hypothetical protein [Terriglobus roseus]AFL87249.1 hypothetical protein Terro_0927 [Terriglobus roseus DSM 18391]